MLEQEVADTQRSPLLLTVPERSSIAPVLDDLLRAPNDRARSLPGRCGLEWLNAA